MPGKREDFAGFFLAGFKVGGIDQAASRCCLQCCLDDNHLCCINNQRDGGLQRESFDDFPHQFGFIAAFGDRNAHIQRVRAKIDLIAGNLEHAVIIFRQQQPLEGAGTLRVEPRADHERRGLLLESHRLNR